MRNFKVTVNGTTYDVAVEEVLGGGQPIPASAPAQAPVASAPAPAASAPAPAPKPAANVSASAFKLTAPMPGTIVDVKISVGDNVQKDQVGLILEAMKMENEIVIPIAGKVTSVNVSKGSAVKTGDILLTVE